MDRQDESKIGKVSKGYADVGPYISAGTQYAASIVVCLFIGWWLDVKFGTSPWLVVVGIVLGAVSGFYNLYKTLISGGKQDQDKQKEA
jgi:ATP synthase protein I